MNIHKVTSGSWEEKRELRFRQWLSPNIEFKNQEAEKRYKERVTRFIKVIKLEEPDRVPVILPIGFYPAYYAGYNLKTVMNDYELMKKAWLKFMKDFPEMDTFGGPAFVLPAKVLKMIGLKTHKWPGDGLPDDAETYQFVEREYMKPDEYDSLIQDPSDFWLRTFMPRQAEAFAPLAKLPQLTPFIGIPIFYLSSFGDPEIQGALKTMMAAGEEVRKWQAAVTEVSTIALQSGYPSIWGGLSGAPFDMLTDMCRGTTGIMIDIFRQPQKVIEAAEKLVPIIVKEAVRAASNSLSPIIVMPLHKGNKTFMSNKHFEQFYWPTLKEVIMGIVNEGLVPMLFAEGDYEPRLDIIKDVPPRSVIWWFEHMDMAKAKRTLGEVCCIAGNIPVSLLRHGTPEDVEEYCRRLIDICAPGGGYILTGSAAVDKGKPENLRAVLRAVEKYGRYVT